MELGAPLMTSGGPFAAPEWRWLRARRYVQDRKRSPAIERDPGVLAAIEFMEETSKCFDDYDWEKLQERYMDEYLAMLNDGVFYPGLSVLPIQKT